MAGGVSVEALRRLRDRRSRVAARRHAGAPAPAAVQQEALWFLDQMLGPAQNSAYNVNSVLHLNGPLDQEALGCALSEVVHRHEALRCRFEPGEDGLIQVASPAAPIVLRAHQVAAGELETALLAESTRPYDLSAGPLYRARLFRLEPEHHALALGFHHIVFDGWSLGVLFRELSDLYAAYAEGLSSPLRPLQLSYGDYAAWQRELLAGQQVTRHVDYWRGQLGDAPRVTRLPYDRPRPAQETLAGAEWHVTLPDGLAAGLRQRAQAQRVSLYMLLLAAFALLLSRLSGSAQVCVGGVVPGRTRTEFEALIGYFVNTIVVRGDLSGSPGFTELLARTRDTVLAAYDHQDLPFVRVVQEVAPHRSLAHNPLYQVMFLFQELSDDQLALPGLDTWLQEAPAVQAKCDLTLAMWESGGALVAAFEYATDLFDRSTIERFAAQLRQILQDVCDGVDP